jgi:hypothetical protein
VKAKMAGGDRPHRPRVLISVPPKLSLSRKRSIRNSKVVHGVRPVEKRILTCCPGIAYGSSIRFAPMRGAHKFGETILLADLVP